MPNDRFLDDKTQADDARVQRQRLRLQPIADADLHDLHRHWTEPDVLRYLWDGKVVTQSQVAEIIRTSSELFDREAVGLWSLRSRESDDLLGCAGYWPFHEPAELELLVSLSARFWGRGFAREAAAALIDYAFTQLGWDYVQAAADEPNVRSLRLLQSLGMRPHRDVPGELGQILIYRISRDEFASIAQID